MRTKRKNKRPGTGSARFGLFTLAVLVLSVPLFAAVKEHDPLSTRAGHGFAQKAVEFSLADLSGQMQSLAAHEGKGLFLYFFTDWFCPSGEDLEKINEVYHDNLGRRDRFEFIGICCGCDKAEAQKLAREKKLEFPVCADPDMTAARAYGVPALPLFLVISAWRTVKWEHAGAIGDMKETFEQPFDRYLGIRLDVWRYRHGTPEEQEAFKKTLTPAQKLRRYDAGDERFVRIAKKVGCICDERLNLAQCDCDIQYRHDMYTWMNFFVQEGSFTEDQIAQILTWRLEGEKRKKEGR